MAAARKKKVVATPEASPTEGLIDQYRRHEKKLSAISEKIAEVSEKTARVVEEIVQREAGIASLPEADDLITRANVFLERLNAGGPVDAKDRRAAFIALTFAYSKMIVDFGLDTAKSLAELETFIDHERASQGGESTQTTATTH